MLVTKAISNNVTKAMIAKVKIKATPRSSDERKRTGQSLDEMRFLMARCWVDRQL